MYKLAFFVEMEKETPDSYQIVLKGEEMQVMVCGVNTMETASETAKKISMEGYDELVLCGAFDESKAIQIREKAVGKMKVAYETYSPAEFEKFKALESLDPMGIIIHVGDMPFEITHDVLRSEEANTHVVLVNGMEEAMEAAQELVNQQVKFIEPGTYFDQAKAEMLIAAIKGAAPVGFPVRV